MEPRTKLPPYALPVLKSLGPDRRLHKSLDTRPWAAYGSTAPLPECGVTHLPTRREFLLSGTAAVGAAALAPMLPWPPGPARYHSSSRSRWRSGRSTGSCREDHRPPRLCPGHQGGLGPRRDRVRQQLLQGQGPRRRLPGDMNQRAADHAVNQHLIMCDGEGRLGDPDAALRTQAVENHYQVGRRRRDAGLSPHPSQRRQRRHVRGAAESSPPTDSAGCASTATGTGST